MKKLLSLALVIAMLATFCSVLAVSAEETKTSLIPGEGTTWGKTDCNGASITVEYKDGAAVFSGSVVNSWPAAEAWYVSTPVVADVEDDYLSIDLKIEGGSTNINFFFENSADSTSSYSFTICNTAMGVEEGKYDAGSGDLYDAEYKLNLKMSDLVASTKLLGGDAFPAAAIVDGQVKFIGIQVYSVNGAVVTVNDLSVVNVTADSTESSDAESSETESSETESSETESSETESSETESSETESSETESSETESSETESSETESSETESSETETTTVPGNVAAGKTYTSTAIYVDGSGVTNYPDEDGKTLTDGVTAPTNIDFADPAWVGFNKNSSDYDAAEGGEGAVVVIDLGDVQTLSGATIYSYKQTDVGITVPYFVKVSVSTDGENYTEAGYVELKPDEVAEGLYNIECTFANAVEAKYVKTNLYMYGWGFISEIEAIGEVEATDAPATSESAPAASDDTPKTGDAGILVFAVLAVVAICGAAVTVKVRG